MDKKKPTLAIYGIQDRQEYEHPFYVHDHNLALTEGGKVINFLQQERVSRKKRDNTFHIHLKDILKEKKLLAADYDLVFVDNTVGRTFLTRQGDARFEAPLAAGLATGLERGKCWWFGKERTAYALNHELAHLYSCLPFFGNFRENSLLVHFDGGASQSNFSAAHLLNGNFRWLEYHWDMKPYSSIYNANALVFAILGAKLPQQNAVPGKFMGFSGWGTASEELKEWLQKNSLFQDIWGKTSLFFQRAEEDFGVVLQSFDLKNRFIQDVAASLQEIFIDRILQRLQKLAEATKADYLYYTGGSALNIVANTRIINSGIFREVFIPPCTEDSGLALGAAAFTEWKKHGNINVHAPYLNNWNIETVKFQNDVKAIEKTAELLAGGKVIGVCNGWGEAGPRALGNRSILALAGSKKLAAEISIGMKGREWYRPLAPVALMDNVKYFTGLSTVPEISKYMLLDFNVLPERRKELKGAVHADGTARFQTLFSRHENQFLFDLLSILNDKYQIKALINTSFNQKNEPIVHTCNDALAAAENMKLYALVLNGGLQILT